DHPEAHELGALEPGNHPQHARLLSPLHLRLEADEAEVIAGNVVLAQLDDGVGFPAGAGVAQPDGFHRPEPQRVDAARRHHLDRQAALEEFRWSEWLDAGLLGRRQRGVEGLVFLSGERAVEIVPLPIVDAACLTARAYARGQTRV